MAELSRHSKQEAELLRQEAQLSRQEAQNTSRQTRVNTVIAFVAMLYLPATLVAVRLSASLES